MWQIWDKQSNINNVSASDYLAKNNYFSDNEIILLRIENEKVVEVQGKSILANIYNIDSNLDTDAFVAEYERVINELNQTEIVESETL